MKTLLATAAIALAFSVPAYATPFGDPVSQSVATTVATDVASNNKVTTRQLNEQSMRSIQRQKQASSNGGNSLTAEGDDNESFSLVLPSVPPVHNPPGNYGFALLFGAFSMSDPDNDGYGANIVADLLFIASNPQIPADERRRAFDAAMSITATVMK